MGKSSENAMTFRVDTGEQYDESDENSDDGQHMLTRCESMETVGACRRVNQNSRNATRESKSAMSLVPASDDKDERAN